jgi:hypothetical protein
MQAEQQAVAIAPSARPDVPLRLAETAETAGERMTALVLREIPHYRTLNRAQLAEVQRIESEGFKASMVLWREGRLARREELAPFRATGAARAAEGRPLAAVLRAYRLGGMAAFEYVIERCGDELGVVEAANYAVLVMAFIDQLCDVVTQGYVEASSQLAGQQQRASRELFEDLIAGRFGSVDEIVGRAEFLGVTIPRQSSVVVAAPVEPENVPPPLTERGAIFERELRRAGEGRRTGSPLVLVARNRLVMLAPPLDEDMLERALAKAGLHGVTSNAPTLADVPGAYQSAVSALELIRANRVPFRRLLSSTEAAIITHLSETAATNGGFAHEILKDLVDDRQLIDTLDAYFSAGNAVSAAHRLGVHPQTMRYRLRKIRELTGRDPAQGWDRFVLELSLRLSAIATTNS